MVDFNIESNTSCDECGKFIELGGYFYDEDGVKFYLEDDIDFINDNYGHECFCSNDCITTYRSKESVDRLTRNIYSYLPELVSEFANISQLTGKCPTTMRKNVIYEIESRMEKGEMNEFEKRRTTL